MKPLCRFGLKFPARFVWIPTFTGTEGLGKQLKKKGQATVEYLLLAVIIIIIGKVIVSPMGKSLQEWATKMLGPKGYYACLLEHGLIPGGRWEDSGIDCSPHKSVAFSELKNIEDSGGGSLSGGSSSSGSSSSGGDGSSGGNSSGGGSDSGEGGDSKNKKSGRKKRGPSSNSGDGSGDSFTEGSGSEDPNKANSDRFSALKSGKKNKSSGKKSRRRARKKKPKKAGAKDVKIKSARDSSEDGEGGIGVGYLGERFSIEYEDEEADKPPPVFQAQGSISKTGEETSASQKKKNRMQITGQAGGNKGNVTDLTPMTFGNYMKWLIIAILVIAVVLVIGSQILEFQNADT